MMANMRRGAIAIACLAISCGGGSAKPGGDSGIPDAAEPDAVPPPDAEPPDAMWVMPTDGLGHRPDGSDCYTVGPGPHQLAPPPRNLFQGANLSLSHDRGDSLFQAETEVAVDPATGAAVGAFIAIN